MLRCGVVFLFLSTASSRESRPALTHLRGGDVHKEAVDEPSPIGGMVKDVHNLFLTPHGERGVATERAPRRAATNVLAGVTTALAMVPEAISFSFVAGVSPLVGLWTTVAMGGIVGLLGGRGGVMTGASGACAVVVAALCEAKGAEGGAYLSATAVLAGLLQIIAGQLKLGKFIRLVPHPVMLGFVNGLAVVMFRAQLRHFRDPVTGLLLRGAKGATMLAVTLGTAALIKLLPMLTTAVPASLMAITIASLATKLLRLPATTLADIAGADTFKGGFAVLPKLALPCVGAFKASPLSFLSTIFPYAASMAAAGLIESLLTLQLVDGLVDDGTRGSTSAECRGQGVANVAAGLTGGIGGCALIGQSLIATDAGGTARLAGVVMSLALALGIVVGAPLLAAVPIGSLVGLMLVVCHSTFNWSSLRLIGSIPPIDTVVLAIVSVVVVCKDLAVAVVVGTVLSALSFAWTQSTRVALDVSDLADHPTHGHVLTHSVRGQLFFGSARHFQQLFAEQPLPLPDVDCLILDFLYARILDLSAVEAIGAVAARFGAQGKKVVLRHLPQDLADLLRRDAGPELVVEKDKSTDPEYGSAAAEA